MTTSKLYLIQGATTIDLNNDKIRSSDGGYAVVGRPEGFGLDSLSGAWSDPGLGDGSVWGGIATTPRQFKLRVLITATRNGPLKARVQELNRVLTHRTRLATLRLVENDGWGDVAWEARVAFAGIENIRTDYETQYAVTVALRAESPYWESSEKVVHTITVPSQSGGTFTVPNDSNVPARPIIQWPGWTSSTSFGDPTNGWDRFALSPSGATSVTLVIDCEALTVTDTSGKDRYSDLVTASFPVIPPGGRTFTKSGASVAVTWSWPKRRYFAI